jgi:serine/threonine-protein kinase
MVPEHRMHGGSWGHGASCRREPVAGAEVRVARFETKDVRLVPGPETLLGKTPLDAAPLAPGSWRATLSAPGFAPVYVPFVVKRGEPLEIDVTLYRPAEIPEGFVQIPGGPFPSGGSFGGGEVEDIATTRDLFIARFSLTAGEYLDFLNDVVKNGRFDEARARAPRENTERFLAETPRGFELAAPGHFSAVTDRRFPAIGLSWHDALAYAAWLSARDGRPYSLPEELEWEKAARGADRRVFPYGEEDEWSYAHIAGSLPEGTKLLPVGSFPLDESPFGVRDMAGCVSNWLLNNVEVPYRHYRALRGGAWFIGPANSRIPYRRGFVAEMAMRYFGARLCLRPVRF